MSLIKWRDRTLPTVNTFFDNFFRDDDNLYPAFFRERTVPAVNVSEDDKYFRIAMAAPGLTREDFHVGVERNMLVIKSEKEVEKEEEEKTWTRKEYNYTAFERSFWMPENVLPEKISATYRDGILTVTLPKKEVEVKKTKAIEVK
ncbi:MAG: Hsp20/alpha crystallin family protein [Saprospiraceae bacterium]|nr:Hsp20/alpha crystallin family protein [Saprospiraceae bacterium]